MFSQISLLFGLMVAPGMSPLMPYFGVPIGWSRSIVHESEPFLHLGVAEIPILVTQETAGLPMQHVHWRSVALVGVGWAFNGDVYASAGAQIGEGARPYGSIGVRFWPFGEPQRSKD